MYVTYYSSLTQVLLARTGIVSTRCKENNLVASKRGALIVLKALLGKPIDVDLLEPAEKALPYDTVVPADTVRAVEGVEVEKAD